MIPKPTHFNLIGIREGLRTDWNGFGEWKTNCHLIWLRSKAWAPKNNSRLQFLGYNVRITDGPNFYMQFKDEFVRRIYDFQSERANPLIIDGGSNIGMSLLCFKHRYPNARIIAFEPDPEIFRILEENVRRNSLKDVRLINAGLDEKSGETAFVPDGSAGGHLGNGKNSVTVRSERLSDYLDQEVDFLKLNIEGQELAVLQEVEHRGRLRNIRELVLEYHGWANGKQYLGDILNLLDREGFRYFVHDFDEETCPTSKPPFHWTPEAVWFCLVYARRVEGKSS